MIIFPAIDIKDGKVVRLLQGRFDKVTVYSNNPVTMAQQWKKQGAEWLHLVDLDGAKTGEMKNFPIIAEIAATVGIPVEVGGGIRDEAAITRLIDAGVKRVILGTTAVTDQNFLTTALKRWPGQIAVSLDCKNGKIAQHGWVEVTDLPVIDYAQKLTALGVGCFIYTDIKRDGMLSGPDLAGLRALLAATGKPVIASGGVTNINDIIVLKKLAPLGLLGAITGKAIYENTLNLNEAITVCSQKE